MAIPLMPLLGQGATPGVLPEPAQLADALAIEIDDATGAVRIGGTEPIPVKPASFDENIAERLDEAALASIAEMLLAGIEADERSRREMIDQDAQALCHMVVDVAEMLRSGVPPGRKLRPVR